jgi:DNA repair and recombination protein RAD54 and RAD54-like protein
MGRIYRPKQVKACVIYRLFTSGTIEEVILQRQIQKGALATLTVDSGSLENMSAFESGIPAKLSKEELTECFNLKENSICDTKVKLGTCWPSYDPSNLLELGCNDLPLLEVATKIPKTLCFVHINNYDEPEFKSKDISNENSMKQEYESDCEEHEFTM